jgi:hypothetical protein
VQAVVDELVAEVTERVDNAVENGRIDQTEADEKLAEAEAKITDMVNNGAPPTPGLTARNVTCQRYECPGSDARGVTP